MKNKISYHFILNPTAGRGKSYRAIVKIRKLLSEKNINHTFSITNAPNHATQLARLASNNHNVVVAIGGDGTVNEVMNGLINSNSTLGVIPMGSGNDFANALKIPNNILEAIDVILKNNKILIDIGKVITKENKLNVPVIQHERYFINGVGIGFDALVAYESSKIKYLRGLPLYIVAIIKALLKYKAPSFVLNLDDIITQSKYFLIAIGNGIRAGGGFYLTPNAKLNDNIFDICSVQNLNLGRIIKIFPSVLKGLHYKFKEVHFTKAKKIKVESSNKFNVHADGEIVGNKVNKVEISIIPSRIAVITNNIYYVK